MDRTPAASSTIVTSLTKDGPETLAFLDSILPYSGLFHLLIPTSSLVPKTKPQACNNLKLSASPDDPEESLTSSPADNDALSPYTRDHVPMLDHRRSWTHRDQRLHTIAPGSFFEDLAWLS